MSKCDLIGSNAKFRAVLDRIDRVATHSNNGTFADPLHCNHSVSTVRAQACELGSSSAPPIVFVVDDDVFSRQSTELLIRRVGWRSEAFAFAREFLDRPHPVVSNCLVLNVRLQGANIVDLQRRIVNERAETPIIFIADRADVPTTVQAMKAGAVEFFIKPFVDEALISAIREALERSAVALVREAEMRLLRDCYALLSQRERQVMALVVSGLLNKQVGAELGISEITVKAHRGRVMQKMAANSVADLVRMAARLRLERPSSASHYLKSPAPSQIATQPASAFLFQSPR